MIMTVEFLRRFIQTEEEDQALEARLQALESLIQAYTNNDFKRHLSAEGEYPMDVKMGVVNLMKWEMGNRAKVGVQSESLSRHSVTYFNMDGDNSIMGYPRSLMGFLKPYVCARFGQGLSV
jgi:alkylated DNA repair dioxygenase AlkB